MQLILLRAGGTMSTPLIVLAAILAFFALVLIPFMMVKGDRRHNTGQQSHGHRKKHSHKKKKKH